MKKTLLAFALITLPATLLAQDKLFGFFDFASSTLATIEHYAKQNACTITKMNKVPSKDPFVRLSHCKSTGLTDLAYMEFYTTQPDFNAETKFHSVVITFYNKGADRTYNIYLEALRDKYGVPNYFGQVMDYEGTFSEDYSQTKKVIWAKDSYLITLSKSKPGMGTVTYETGDKTSVKEQAKRLKKLL